MSITVWPPELPQRPSEDTEYWTDSGVVRSNVEVGPPKSRRRTTRVREFFRTGMLLTGAQLEVFRAFMATIQGGAGVFEWIHPITDAPARCRFVREPRWRLWLPAAQAVRRWQSDLEIEILGPAED